MNKLTNNESTFIFTIARMNPPTTGHKLLIKQMIIKALELNLTQINIILSASVDDKTNPLECEEKRYLLYSGLLEKIKSELKPIYPEKIVNIDNINVEIICMNDETTPDIHGTNPIIKSINYLLLDIYNYPRDNLRGLLFIGQDRINDFGWLIQSYLTKIPPVTIEIIGLERPIGAMSATFIRKLAKEGKYDEFSSNMLDTGIPESEIKQLYNNIQENIKGGKSLLKRKLTNKSRKNMLAKNKIKNKKNRTHRYTKKCRKYKKMLKNIK